MSEDEILDLNLSDEGIDSVDQYVSHLTAGTTSISSPSHSLNASSTSSPIMSSSNFLSRLSTPKSPTYPSIIGKERIKDSTTDSNVGDHEKKITLQEALNILDAEDPQ